MARFYAAIQGSRGEATRMGGEASGINGHIRGWDSGVKVFGHVTVNGEDEFTIYSTGGSNGAAPDRMIGTVNAKGVFIPADIPPKPEAIRGVTGRVP